MTTKDMQAMFADLKSTVIRLGKHYLAKPPRTDVGMHPIPQDFIFPK